MPRKPIPDKHKHTPDARASPPQVAPFAAVVGQTMSQMRTARGLSQSALAKQLGLAQSVVSRIENGGLPLTVEVLARYAEALGTTPSEILRTAERGARLLRGTGVEVPYKRPPLDGGDTAALIIGGAAIGALIALAVVAASEK
jgi:transcriptional regulator with XRE-family HTH domain